MDENIRSSNIYERSPVYQVPPLIPLPSMEDLYGLEDLKLKQNLLTRIFIKLIFKWSGLTDFYQQLQNNLEHYLRHTDMRSRALYLPVVSATLALEDDPQKSNLIERTISLIKACYSFYTDIHSGRLEQDRWRGHALEMGQYANFFATNVVIDEKHIGIFKSSLNNQILVVINNHTFLIKIENWDDKEFDLKFQQALQRIIKQSQTEAPPVGILTAPATPTQVKIFKTLRKSSMHSQNLDRLKHVFVTICLEPDLKPETTEQAYRLAHSGNFANRWWHSSLQLVVFGNGKSCLIGNFSTYLDGNVMMRGASEIQKRARQNRVRLVKPTLNQPFPFEELKWTVPKALYRLAQKDLDKIKDTNQQEVFVLKTLHKDFFKQKNISAIAVFVLALHSTLRQLIGKHPEIHQFVSLSQYRCMDLTTTVVSTEQVKSFVDQFLNAEQFSQEIHREFLEAIQSQKEAVRKARQSLSFADILTLFFLNSPTLKRIRAQLLITPALRLLNKLNLVNLRRREVVISHPAIYAEIPLVGRPGVRLPYVKYLGLHYQIWPDKIVVTYMPGTDWPFPNETITNYLEANLSRLKKLIESDS